jgi:hypothetical protein
MARVTMPPEKTVKKRYFRFVMGVSFENNGFMGFRGVEEKLATNYTKDTNY